MNERRLPDYLDHLQQAAADACGFVAGMAKEDFLADKRTQQAVITTLRHPREGEDPPAERAERGVGARLRGHDGK